MAIIFKNKKQLKKAAIDSRVTQSTPVASRASNENINNNNKESYVVVNGEKKPIGKKSKYLLDMLTIEED
jgi:hypothetical protein